jgi:hypothetical protein
MDDCHLNYVTKLKQKNIALDGMIHFTYILFHMYILFWIFYSDNI